MSKLGPIRHFLSPLSCDSLVLSVTRSQVWMRSRCVKFCFLTLSYWSLEVQHGTSWQRTLMANKKLLLYINNNNNLLHLYSTFLDTQSALHSKGAISSSTTNVQHPPGWCDGSHSAPERPPHTSLLVERRQSDEANQCMGMIRRPWWSEASGLVWPGCRGNTPTLFRRTSWDFNDHRESGPRFSVSSEGRIKMA